MNYEFCFDIPQEDIDAGAIGECHLCPIALSGQRYFGEHYYVIVDRSGMYLYRNKESVNFRYPILHLTSHGDAYNFVREFDRNRRVSPQPVHYTLEGI